jgi:hypothetical protein
MNAACQSNQVVTTPAIMKDRDPLIPMLAA